MASKPSVRGLFDESSSNESDDAAVQTSPKKVAATKGLFDSDSDEDVDLPPKKPEETLEEENQRLKTQLESQKGLIESLQQQLVVEREKRRRVEKQLQKEIERNTDLMPKRETNRSQAGQSPPLPPQQPPLPAAMPPAVSDSDSNSRDNSASSSDSEQEGSSSASASKADEKQKTEEKAPLPKQDKKASTFDILNSYMEERQQARREKELKRAKAAHEYKEEWEALAEKEKQRKAAIRKKQSRGKGVGKYKRGLHRQTSHRTKDREGKKGRRKEQEKERRDRHSSKRSSSSSRGGSGDGGGGGGSGSNSRHKHRDAERLPPPPPIPGKAPVPRAPATVADDGSDCEDWSSDTDGENISTPRNAVAGGGWGRDEDQGQDGSACEEWSSSEGRGNSSAWSSSEDETEAPVSKTADGNGNSPKDGADRSAKLLTAEELALRERQARRRQEREEQKQRELREAHEAGELEQAVEQLIKAWRQGKHFEELLTTVGDVFPPAANVLQGGIDLSEPSAAKKAYRKVIRLVHPDKLRRGVPVMERLLAKKLFVLLTEAYSLCQELEEI